MPLVAYYSRTGNTKKIALEIAERLNAEVDPIHCNEYEGVAGWFKGGYDAVKGREADINFSKNASEYDYVVVGTPIWAGTIAPPVRTYLEKNNFKKIAFFCTCGDKQTKAFSEMEKLSKQPLAVLELKTRDIKNNNFEDKLKVFIDNIRFKHEHK